MKQILRNLRMARMAMIFILALLTTQTVQADPATADKAALTTAVFEAETYYSSIQESNPKEAEVLNMLINACKDVQNDANAEQSDVDFATAFMNESVKQCKVAVAKANYAAAIAEAEEYLATIQEKYPAQAEKLNNMINNAKPLMENTSVDVLEFFTQVVTEGIKQIQLEVAQADYAAAIAKVEEYRASIQESHPEQAEKLTNVIENAKAIESTSIEVLEFFTKVLTNGIQTIKKEIAHADLAAAITEAEEYMASIQESNPNVASVMQMLIDAAKQVQDDKSYDLADLEFATAFMKELVVQAKEIVATGVNAVQAVTSLTTKYYDLQGRRMSQPAKGVYIQSGKKYVK